MTDLFNDINPRNKAKILKSLGSDSFTCTKNNKFLSNLVTKNTLLYVEYGNIEIVKISEGGDYLFVEELDDGHSFNFQSLKLTMYNEYEIRVIDDSKIYFIEQDIIYDNFDITTPYAVQFLKNLLKISQEQNEIMNERLEIISHKTIRNRLLCYFNINAKKANSRVIYIHTTFSRLSLYLAADRCAISREMKNLKDEGLIEVSGRKIKLLYYALQQKK